MMEVCYVKKVINPAEVEPLHMPGRDLRWIITPETTGTDKLSIAIMDCPARSVGQGKAWIDGEIVPFKKGDAVVFHANSRHQVMNTGDEMLRTASIFSPPTSPDSYVVYEEDMFKDSDV
jgi:hypothetical protein